MEKITIFDFLKERNDAELFIKSTLFRPYLLLLIDIYNKKLENNEDCSVFLVNKNSLVDWINKRFLFLIKKFLGEEVLLEIYKKNTQELLFIREFLIKNKIEENHISSSFLEEFKKQKNVDLLSSGDFKTEDILYSKIEEEIMEEDDIIEKESKETNKKNVYPNDSETLKRGDSPFMIKGNLLIVFNKDNKIIKQTESYLTVSNKKVPFIKDYIYKEPYYYYLGKFSFGENIKIEYDNEDIKEIVDMLVKKIIESSVK